MNGAIPLLPHTPSWCGEGQYFFYLVSNFIQSRFTQWYCCRLHSVRRLPVSNLGHAAEYTQLHYICGHPQPLGAKPSLCFRYVTPDFYPIHHLPVTLGIYCVILTTLWYKPKVEKNFVLFLHCNEFVSSFLFSPTPPLSLPPSFINPLALELFFLILAHPVYKM